MEETASGLRIIIPSKWSWYTFIVAPALALFFFLAPRTRTLIGTRGGAVILVILLAVTIGRKWLWTIAGKEVVTLANDSLNLRYSILGVGWTIRYRLKDVSNFRYMPPYNGYRVHENRTVVFDYEFLPRRFGLYLTESEVGQLIAVLRPRLANAQGEKMVGMQGPLASV